MFVSFGLWNIVNNNCNLVYVLFIVKMIGKIFLIFFILFIMNIKINGIIKFKIGSVNVEYFVIFNVVMFLFKLNVLIILIGKLIVLKVFVVLLVIKYNIVVFNGLNLSWINNIV